MKKIVLFFIFTFLCKYNFAQSTINNRIYTSDDLIITKLSDNAYMHTSFFQTNDWGKVSCNGMIVVNNKEAVIFDTPTTDTVSMELINWINDSLHTSIIAVIPTHFHADCLGGLTAFHKQKIPSYASEKTVRLAKEKQFAIPQHSFDSIFIFHIGKEKVYAHFVGEGHTRDNIVGYFPKEKVMFGGCLIKEIGAGKGNLEDANTNEWANSVKRLQTKYPNAQIIIPGHGQQGNQRLLDYTIQLFQ